MQTLHIKSNKLEQSFKKKNESNLEQNLRKILGWNDYYKYLSPWPDFLKRASIRKAVFYFFYWESNTCFKQALVTEQSYTLKAYTTQCILRWCLGKRVQIFHWKFHHMFEGEQNFERRRKKR